MKHLSQGPHGMGSGSPHMRHGSTHSVHENVSSHGGSGLARGGGFGPSSGRGRGGYNNPGGFNNPMGYPPGNQYGHGRGGGHGGQGRGGISYSQNQRGIPTYQSSPQPRGSPAMGAAMPNPGTPTMNPSLPVHPPQQGFNAYIPPTYQNVNKLNRSTFPSHVTDPSRHGGVLGSTTCYRASWFANILSSRHTRFPQPSTHGSSL